MFGLDDITIQKIRGVFADFPMIEKVIIYGSRAKGNYKNGSDIDLTLVGSGVDLSLLYQIEENIDELFLPYSFDLSIFTQIDNANLIDHIRRVGIVFYERDRGKDSSIRP
jgi:predicted nucleotidyltransferase